MSQANIVGHERFLRIQGATKTINYLESKGETLLIKTLKAIRSSTDRMEIVNDAVKYVEFELQAKRAMLMDPVLKHTNANDWAVIGKQLSDYVDYHNRQLKRLHRVRSAIR